MLRGSSPDNSDLIVELAASSGLYPYQPGLGGSGVVAISLSGLAAFSLDATAAASP